MHLEYRRENNSHHDDCVLILVDYHPYHRWAPFPMSEGCWDGDEGVLVDLKISVKPELGARVTQTHLFA